MGHRIFITGSNIADEARALMEQHSCIYEFGDENDSPEEIAAKLKRFKPNGLIVRKGQINSDVIQAVDSLKAICKHGVGVDNIDIEFATQHKTPVMITALANFESVAEHTLGLMLSLLRKIPAQDKRVREGIFDKRGYFGDELLCKTLGLVGFGRIARRLSELVSPFRMKVMAYDPFLKPDQMRPDVTPVRELNELLSAADIVSIHCPLTPDTKGLIGAEAFEIMKDTAYIINTARGAVIDEKALIAALENHQISGAALDTFEKEPPELHNPLFKMDNVIVTTHVGGVSANAFRRMGIGAVRNILSILNSEPPDMSCVLNQEVLTQV